MLLFSLFIYKTGYLIVAKSKFRCILNAFLLEMLLKLKLHIVLNLTAITKLCLCIQFQKEPFNQALFLLDYLQNGLTQSCQIKVLVLLHAFLLKMLIKLKLHIFKTLMIMTNFGMGFQFQKEPFIYDLSPHDYLQNKLAQSCQIKVQVL